MTEKKERTGAYMLGAAGDAEAVGAGGGVAAAGAA